ncbi:MAG: acetyl-CoA carboxylase carboxyltransferase subunit alpha [Spirochaetia bacterium]
MKDKKIERKLRELRALAGSNRPDIHAEIAHLETKLTGHDDGIDAWQRVELARHPKRPTAMDFITMITEDFLELHGDRYFADDPAMIGGIGMLDSQPVTFIGLQKGRNMKENIRRNYGMAHAEGYRKALRLAKQAEKFGRPVITLIDTPGAASGIGAEERGIAEAIARNLKEFSVLEVPVLCFVLGEGMSGGALGIGVGDRVFMLENSIYSVISPEGLALILFRDSSKSQYAAGVMKMTARDLLSFGIIDGIIKEGEGGAHENPELVAHRIKEQIQISLDVLMYKKPADLLKERSARIMKMGSYLEEPVKKKTFIRRLFGK